MVVPALLFVAINAGGAGARGWGIPMATDIAFAVGALALLGSRVPAGLRVLLLALAVIDDIGAILVIAVFYTDGVVLSSLGLAGLGIIGVKVLQMIGVSRAVPYIAPGILVWAGLFDAGVHPSLTGVILGLLTPVQPWQGASSSERVQHVLHPWVAYGIMPLFALANAGVALGGAQLHGDGLLVFLGIVAGLAIGKPIGIFAACATATGSGVAARSTDSTHLGVLLVGMVGGIGFTMSLFVAQLAFPPGPLLDTAKLAILVGSATAMIIGLLFGRYSLQAQT
jgi:NhaA family Na+:H+ antiporter